MFGVGWTEMLLVGVVALVVIGPKDLPVVMNRLGKVVASIRRMGSEFQRELNKTTGLDQLTDLRRSITEPLKQTAQEITKEFNRVTDAGTVEPSGVIAPKEPGAESVVAEIHEKVGMTPVEPGPIAAPVMTARAAEPTTKVESPAPVEAIAPVAKPKAPRKSRPKTPAKVSATTASRAVKATPRAKKSTVAAAPALELFPETTAVKPKKPAAVRKPRAAKPKADA
jgi:sec-independent protein translocase protein TatB